MLEITMWHVPGCPSCVRGLGWLGQIDGVSVKLVSLLDAPPGEGDLEALCAKLALKPSELLRRKEPLCDQLSLQSAGEQEILAAMARHPRLVDRPIVFRDARAVLGRPPVRVLEILRQEGLPPHIADLVPSLAR